MKIESLEQKVANTPAVLLCDGCIHSGVCQWIKDMRSAVVFTNEQCKNAPFCPSGWRCKYFVEVECCDRFE